MAPHLVQGELDWLEEQHKAGKTPITKIAAPNLTSVRKVLKGSTYERSVVETRGRKPLLSCHAVLKLNRVRKTIA